MEITAIFEFLKAAPEGISSLIVVLVLLASLVLKRKDVDFNQVTSVSKLQTEQLSTLIEQNSALAKELHEVRKELSAAYSMIDDMRLRVTELENMLREAKDEADKDREMIMLSGSILTTDTSGE